MPLVEVEPAVFGAASPASSLDESALTLQRMHFAIPGSLAPQSSWVHAVDIEIKELLLLSDGWDGAAAYPVSIEAVSDARALAAAICNALPALRHPTVTPSIDGRVVLEWHSPIRHIDFTVGRDSIEVFYEDEEQGLDWDGLLPDSPLDPLAFLAAHSW